MNYQLPFEDHAVQETFSVSVKEAFNEQSLKRLEELYKNISEEMDVNRAKIQCASLYKHCCDTLLDTVNSGDMSKDSNLKYYAWHFLQLMSCYPPFKIQFERDISLLSLLVNFNSVMFENNDKQKSLKLVSLNFIVYFLGGASDEYFDSVASSNVIHFLYELLDESSMSSSDDMFETILLAMNLLIEGTSKCKTILCEMSFENLMSKKINERSNCHEDLLKVANLTLQKLILLRNKDKSFVEEFRKNFQSEADKQIIYQSVVCSNEKCLQKNVDVNQLKRCSRCKITNYCSKECQRAHWKSSHSKKCSPAL